MDSSNQKAVRGGIPGRLFVLPFIVILAFLLWLVFSMAVRFQTIMRQLETTRSAWPAASSLFSARYERLDESVSQQPGEWKAEFSKLRKQFLATTQFDQQSQVIKKIEEIVGKHRDEIPAAMKLDPGQSEIATIRDSEQKRSSLQSDFVGKCTVGGLRLKLPPVFELQD